MGVSKKAIRRIRGVMFKLPLMLSCEAFEEFIMAFLGDELTPKQKFIFEIHLKLCPECRDYLRAYQASMILAKSADFDPEDASLENVPEDLIKAVIEARKV